MIVPVILSGGSGTRLWPLSRKLHPKQFINLVNETTLFQDTILRLPDGFSDPIIICNEEHRFMAAEQLREINKNSHAIILEPEGRNTAPAIALAALKLLNEDENPVILVLSADHLIENIKAFHNSILVARKLAEKGKLITFGVVPHKAETNYGYIEAKINNDDNYFYIKSFTEKPNQKNATKYFESGNYLWNSGMFMFKASAYISELEKFEPEILLACEKSLITKNIDLDFVRIDANEFKKSPNKSIDYAIMEETKNSIVVPLDAKWSDVGSWSSLWDVKPKDENNNVIEGDVVLKDVKNSYIYSSNRLVSVIGLSHLVIVDTQDALLVSDNQKTHNIKRIVENLQNLNRSEAGQHRKVYRPWGYYDSIDNGTGFQVKRIVVNPGAKLSLQKHRHRAEHWVVVKGIALVTCGVKTFELIENQSTFIPQNSIHRLENHQDTLLEIIEIQTGSYLDEDDIIRIEDDYQRN
jgi:mannose-1-phosphate guanylyltransferase